MSPLRNRMIWWGGPLFAPRWGGPLSAASRLAEEPDVEALASLRWVLRNPAMAVPSPHLQAAWTLPPQAAGLVTQAPAPSRLVAYDRVVRETMAVDQLRAALRLDLGAAGRAVLMHGNDVVADLQLPPTVLPTVPPTQLWDVEAEVTRLATQDLDEATARPLLRQLLAQDLDPLQPFGPVLGLAADSHPATVELVSCAVGLLGLLIFSIKDHLDIQRPHVHHPGIIPLLDVPGHLSYPGGHAAKAHLAATLLGALAAARPGMTSLAHRVADVVADNRVRAGLHHPLDSAAGEVLGRALGNWLIAAANPAAGATTWRGAILEPTGGNPQMRRRGLAPIGSAPPAPIWRELAAFAMAEW